MTLFERLFGRKKKGPQFAIVKAEPPSGLPDFIDAQLLPGQVVIYRPPISVDAEGQLTGGVSLELAGNFLASTISRIAGVDLGEVGVEWIEVEGRFCATNIHCRTWGQTLQVCHPVAPVSAQTAEVFDTYGRGLARKAGEMYKGTQVFDQANALLDDAIRELRLLRTAGMPHLNDAEYVFVLDAMQRALVMSAPIPTPDVEHPPHVVGETYHRPDATKSEQPFFGVNVRVPDDVITDEG